VRQAHLYEAIQYCNAELHYPVKELCSLAHVSRSSYYKWVCGDKCDRQVTNEYIASIVDSIHKENPDKGYRRIRDDLARYHNIKISDKRTLRICRARSIKSVIKYRNNGCTKAGCGTQYSAENILNREFFADAPNQKWVTDVTEFKWYEGAETHKLYLSAILDLYDRRIVSFAISNRNDNALVFNTFERAFKNNQYQTKGCLLHSDRGYQYTSPVFHNRLYNAGMIQSMSRRGRCIDNGPMEGFWGILKREKYYGHHFENRLELLKMIVNYISYYNNKRLQRNLGVMTPMEKHELFYIAA